MNKILLSGLRQSFANVVFTHKVLESASERLEKKTSTIKWINIVITFIVLIIFGLQLSSPDNKIYSFIGAVLTICEVVFLITQLTYNYEQQFFSYKDVALKYLNLRDRYLNLIADIYNGLGDKEIILRRDQLSNQYSIINSISVQTTNNDYKLAQKKLNANGETVEGEEYTWSDEEIDRFLPLEFKLKK